MKLTTILVYGLPERELAFLRENLTGNAKRTDTPDAPVLAVLAERRIGEQTAAQAADCIAISADTAFLRRAAELDMATVCYTPVRQPGAAAEDVDLREPDVAAGSVGLHETDATTDSVGMCEPDASADSFGLSEGVGLCEPGASADSFDMYVEGFDEVGAAFLERVYERHHNIPWTIVETGRCVVREFCMDDLDALFALYDEPGMEDYLEPLYSYEQERAYQQAYLEHMYRFYGYGMWLVCEKATGRLIGRAGVEHREALNGELELGYAIRPRDRNRGYATEVCGAILDYVKAELGFDRVCCLIEPQNTGSLRLAAKLGFRRIGALTLDGVAYEKWEIALK